MSDLPHSASFASKVVLWSWAESPCHLAPPSPPQAFIADTDRRFSAEAVHRALHLQAPRAAVDSFLPLGSASAAVHTRSTLPAIIPPQQQPQSPAAAAPPPSTPPPARSNAHACTRRSSGVGSSGSQQRFKMEEALGSQIATSAVPGGIGFNRVPSGTQGGGGEVTWDEMGQLGLHKALNEYYKLSATQRGRMRCCNRDGTPTMLCTLFHAVVIPQLPAPLAPPGLLAAARWLLYAAAWVLYRTAVLTIPLALWLAFAVDGRFSLASQAGAGVHPPSASAAAWPAVGVQHPALLLAALLVLLRASEAAVLRRRRQVWEAAQRRITAGTVQARYAGWAPPADTLDPPAPAPAATAAQHDQRQQQRAGQEAGRLSPQAAALLSVVQGEVQQLWHSVIGDGLPTSSLQSYEDVAAAVSSLSQETGVELRSPAGGSSNGGMDSGRQLLDAVLQIKHAVGLA